MRMYFVLMFYLGLFLKTLCNFVDVIKFQVKSLKVVGFY